MHLINVYFHSEETLHCYCKRIKHLDLLIYEIESLATRNLMQNGSELELMGKIISPSSIR